MSILKTSLLAASFALTASSANAMTGKISPIYNEMTTYPLLEMVQAKPATWQNSKASAGNERAPFSRQANERFTW